MGGLDRQEILSIPVYGLDYYGGYLYFISDKLERMKPDGSERVVLSKFVPGNYLSSLSVGPSAAFCIANQQVKWTNKVGSPFFSIPTSIIPERLIVAEQWSPDLTLAKQPAQIILADQWSPDLTLAKPLALP